MTLRELAFVLTNTAQERAVERDVEAELAAHLALAAEALEAEGRAPDEARDVANARFGDLDRIRRECLRIRLGGNHAMKTALIVSNVVMVAALLVALLVTRAQHVRAQEAMEQALQAQAAALEAARRARAVAPAPVEQIVVEVGDQIEIVDQHRIADIAQLAAVQPDGQALLIDIGWVEVAGLTREEVEQRLTEAYAPFYEDLEAVNVIVHKAAPSGSSADRSNPSTNSIPTLAALLEARREAASPAPVVVAIGDVIETLDQHRNIDFGEQAVVQPDGKVLLHDVGWFEVVGLTREQVEQRLTEAYAPYYEDLTVNVVVHKK